MKLQYWLATQQWFGLGIVHLETLLTQLGDISHIFACNSQQLAELNMSPALIAAREAINWKIVEEDLRWAEKPQQSIITYADDAYPELLRQTVGAPLILYIRGKKELLSMPHLAIVGSRKPTPVGLDTAYAFAKACGEIGLGVISGLALGIDAAAHRGVLTAGGQTIAVLGSGLDVIYPRQHNKLAATIAEQGLLISEFSPKTQPVALNFPRRNRIISGLSVGVLIVEAALQSGSLITARYAIEQGREVFAIPGSIYNHFARGSHQLIRQGAKLVESIQDIVEELTSTVDFLVKTRQDDQHSASNMVSKPPLLSPMQQQLWQALDDAPTTLDQLLARSQLTHAQVLRELVSLELQGYVQTVAGGYVRGKIIGYDDRHSSLFVRSETSG
jgi:DNA processing protein